MITREEYNKIKDKLPYRISNKVLYSLFDIDSLKKGKTKEVEYSFESDIDEISGTTLQEFLDNFKEYAENLLNDYQENDIKFFGLTYSDYNYNSDIVFKITYSQKEEMIDDDVLKKIAEDIKKFKKEDNEYQEYLKLKEKFGE